MKLLGVDSVHTKKIIEEGESMKQTALVKNVMVLIWLRSVNQISCPKNFG